jgi:hypothetical protein
MDDAPNRRMTAASVSVWASGQQLEVVTHRIGHHSGGGCDHEALFGRFLPGERSRPTGVPAISRSAARSS